MKAAVMRAVDGPMTVEEVDVADPSAREVLVQTKAAGLCHSDLSVMNGYLPAPPLPAILGHESAGIVEAVGSDVTHVQPGDHVVTCLSAFCGGCDECVRGRPYLCEHRADTARAASEPPRLTQHGAEIHQFAGLGSFAERLLVHENATVRIEPGVPFEIASILGCAVVTGLGAVLNTARVPPGATVAVIGCGGVGLSTIQGALIAGASRIIAIDTNAAHLDAARVFGATEVLDASEGDLVGQVIDLTNGGVDFAFEVVGTSATAEAAIGMLAFGGTATLVGVPPADEPLRINGRDLQTGDRRVLGCKMGSTRFRLDIPTYIKFFRQGRLKLGELVTSQIELSEINDGYELLRRGTGHGRTVVVF
jgi:S-(hydroxymethyl)glutathione dehydrogenase / alcohol dehydrogenase